MYIGVACAGFRPLTFTKLRCGFTFRWWWGGFASYDRYQTGAMDSYGKGYNVQVVRMDRDFQIVERWQIPDHVREEFEIMSNSGGSWGPDGYLYLTPHTPPYTYVFELPKIGSVLHHVATVHVPDIAGQGIAWDRWADTPTLVGIYRPNKTVIISQMPTKEEIDAVGIFQNEAVIHTDPSSFTT